MRKILPCFSILIPVLFIAAIALLFLFAPLILETLAERKAAGLGFKDPRLRVRTFTHRTILLSDLSIGAASGPDIKISKLSAGYSLPDLLRGKVERVEVSGLEAKARFQDGEFLLQGVPAPGGKGQIQIRDHAIPPLLASYVKVDSSFLDLNIFHNSIRVPFECEFKEKEAPGEYEIHARSSLLGQEFLAAGELDMKTGNGNFEISAARLDLKSLEFFSSGSKMPLTQGGGGGGIRFALAAWKPEGVKGYLDLKNANWEQKDFKISGSVRADFAMPDINARVEISHASLGRAGLGSPFSCSVSGRIPSELKMECSALKLSSPYQVSVSDFHAGSSAVLQENFSAALGRVSLSNHILFSHKDKKARLGGKWKLKMEALSVLRNSGFEVLEMELPVGFPKADESAKGTFAAKEINLNGVKIKNINGSIWQVDEAGPSVNGAVEDVGKWIEKFEIRGEGRVPLHDLFPGMADPPELIFSFFALPGKGPELGFDFEFPENVFPAKTQLHGIHPSLQCLNFSGSIAAKGGISVAGQGTSSHATLTVRNGGLALEGQRVSIEGLNADLKFTGLLNLTTGPGQEARFDKLSWGSIPMSDGKAFFQVEGPESIFLRHGEFKLGNGKIAFDEARFNPGKGELDAVLSCEDVGLSEMLNLLYAKKIATGECRISGKVPVRIKNGNIYVSKGSFYSAPGESGVIKIKESGIIFGGNPLVEEAIKEFRYDQVQVDLNSKGEKLDIFMNLKGAPNRTLPLALDPKTKNFKRDEKGKGVNLQGLHLELRFNEIPLDELIKKRKLFQEIL